MTDEPGFGKETHSTYEPLPEEIVARRVTVPAAHTPDLDKFVETLTIALTWVPAKHRPRADAALSDLAATARENMSKESGLALIEDARRWQRAYNKARDELATTEANLRAATDLLTQAEKVVPGLIQTAGRFVIGDVAEARDRAGAAEARVAELEAALREIAGSTPTSHRKEVDQLRDAVKWRQGIARDVLARMDSALAGDGGGA